MNLTEKLKILKTQCMSYFVDDQARNFVLFLEDFFPSEKFFGLFGFTFFNRLHNNTNHCWQKRIFWTSIVTFIIIMMLVSINFGLIARDSERFLEAVESFSWVSGYGMNIFQIFLLCYWKRAAIMKIVERLDQNFPHSNREQLQFGVLRHLRHLKVFYRICFLTNVWVWIHFNYMPILLLCTGHELELSHPIYFPLDPLQPLLYPIFFIIQSWIILLAFSIATSIGSFVCSLTCVTAMEFDVLAQKLSQIDRENDLNAEKKLKEIIDDYNELTDITDEIEEIFSSVLLINIFSGIFMLCTCVFIAFTPIRLYLMIKYIITLPSLLAFVFCICFFGEQLQTSSTRVADEAYNCNWYGKNLKFRKMILLTMLRAQQAQKLTGMKFMDVGLPVFYWSLQTAHSYYSLLCGVYKP
ncbi:hypothetical protein PVAND_001065 [Polypedilum vanderplanki]|uniref:Odorant receptor n=1 Tax=Polypedilum vanderplanki TaxID=319348 RepID=A0A9J6BN50_POLVA|nr:hypothetical protein PVAND_001065 [Polypedilum vanderplanki]